MAKKKEQSEIFHNNPPRHKWTPEQQVRLWVKHGGYCALCSAYLLENPYTGDKTKYGEFAHIIAHGRGGTRPNDKDVPLEYVDSEDNIIVLCPTCHTTIDKKENEAKYSEEWLRKVKRAHEDKIRLQTLPTLDNLRTAIKLVIPIGGNVIEIKKEQIREALFPDYFPGQERPYEIKLDLYSEERDENYWALAANELKGKFNADIKPALKQGDKLAIFAIGPMPLLVLFGRLIANYKTPRVYNLFRNKDNAWSWPNDSSESFIVNRYGNRATFKNKALVLSLTSSIRQRIDDGQTLLYEITPENGPRYESVRSAQQLEQLNLLFMQVLDEMSKLEGQTIHVYMAAPNSVAVIFGMSYMPKANNELIIHDYLASSNKDIPAITLNY